MSELEDSVLMTRITSGDGAALAHLYDRYGRIAYGLAYRVLNDPSGAEEAVQDAFLQVWRKADSFNVDKGAGFQAWLLTIVHNRSIDQIRRRANRQGKETVLLDDGPYIGEPDPSIEVLAGLQRDDVRKAMQTLPDDQRLAIEMAYFQGLTHREISDCTGIPLGTIKSRLRLGLRKLSEQLATGSAEHLVIN